jgi:hypothetical protein
VGSSALIFIQKVAAHVAAGEQIHQSRRIITQGLQAFNQCFGTTLKRACQTQKFWQARLMKANVAAPPLK